MESRNGICRTRRQLRHHLLNVRFASEFMNALVKRVLWLLALVFACGHLEAQDSITIAIDRTVAHQAMFGCDEQDKAAACQHDQKRL